MFKPTHMPNKLEISMAIIVVFFAVIATGVLFMKVADNIELSFGVRTILFCVLLVSMVMLIQAVIQFFYSEWQRKNVK